MQSLVIGLLAAVCAAVQSRLF